MRGKMEFEAKMGPTQLHIFLSANRWSPTAEGLNFLANWPLGGSLKFPIGRRRESWERKNQCCYGWTEEQTIPQCPTSLHLAGQPPSVPLVSTGNKLDSPHSQSLLQWLKTFDPFGPSDIAFMCRSGCYQSSRKRSRVEINTIESAERTWLPPTLAKGLSCVPLLSVLGEFYGHLSDGDTLWGDSTISHTSCPFRLD